MEIMQREAVNSVIAKWTRLGAMFNVSACDEEVDVEYLLLDTARMAAMNSRLFILAVTWLSQYGSYVARHRLARLIGDELENEHRQTMGLMLDLAKQKGADSAHRFNKAIEACGEVIDHKPLLDVSRRSDLLAKISRQSASALSLKWGRWVEDFELKLSALRPPHWIIEKNPSLRWRSDFKGDLRASVVVELLASAGRAESESDIARRCGVTYSAALNALESLERSGWIRRKRRPHSTEIVLVGDSKMKSLVGVK